jgi:AcrR family transcriptional regulator
MGPVAAGAGAGGGGWDEGKPGGRGRRRLDPSRDAAILQAALAGLAECGYDRLSMDDIASRAHVGKAALYRRWRSKAAVAAAAVAWWREQLGVVAAPDTGTLRGDVEALLAAVPDMEGRDQTAVGVVMDVATAASRDRELAAALEEYVLAGPRQVLAAVLARAAARGEIPPGRDLSLAPDIVLGLNMLRRVTGKPVDRAFVRQVFENVIMPLAVAPVTAVPHPGPAGPVGQWL